MSSLNESPLSTAPNKGENQDARTNSAVVVLSTMRAGSTLLKALMATAPDISDLPEINFQRYQSENAFENMCNLASDPIVVLKRPAWFTEVGNYPKLPNSDRVRKIVLIRDVYETTASVRKMLMGSLAKRIKGFGNKFLTENYWCSVCENLLDNPETTPKAPNTLWIHYEDLVHDPIKETKRIFEFVGSEQKEGVASYNKPETGSWKWGQDDGGEKIRTLQVQEPPATQYTNEKLLKTIKNSKRIEQVRQRLRYAPLPTCHK
jgi:LPS sulfotransferase NodH